jgi:hypothetical protein
MIVTASSIPPTIMLQNTINALSSCLSVLTSLAGFLIFIVSFISLMVEVVRRHRLPLRFRF